jgi:hypothetical protein
MGFQPDSTAKAYRKPVLKAAWQGLSASKGKKIATITVQLSHKTGLHGSGMHDIIFETCAGVGTIAALVGIK